MLFGCKPSSDVLPNAPVLMKPATMYVGEEVLVDITGGTIDFSTCETLDDWDSQPIEYLAVHFSFFDATTQTRQSQIQLAAMEHVSSERMAISLSLGQNVPSGTYVLEFQCNTNERVSARFYVRKKIQEYNLQFEPGYLVNGKSEQEIHISLVGDDTEMPPTFSSKPTSIFFSVDDDDILVQDISINEQNTIVTVVLDVSELALDPGIDDSRKKAVEVMLVSYPTVYYGEINIVPGEHPTISITPTRLGKPLYNGAEVQYDLTITSKDDLLKAPDTYVGSAPYLSFEFPQNPGIIVDKSSIRISASDPLKAFCTVTVDNSAILGPAAMMISLDGAVSYASVNIVPTGFDDHAVQLSPPIIPSCACGTAGANCHIGDECPKQLVFVKPIGFEFDASWEVFPVDSSVTIVRRMMGPKEWALWVQAQATSGVDSIRLQFTNGTDEIVTHLLINQVAGNALIKLDTANRGEDDEEVVKKQVGKFYKDTLADFYLYGGIPSDTLEEDDNTDTDISEYNEHLVLDDFSVEADAPTGPMSMTTYSNVKKFSDEGFFDVEPALGQGAYILSDFEIIWLANRTATIVFSGQGGFTFGPDTQLFINDAGIQVEEMVLDPDMQSTATVTLNISRSVRRGIKTFYFYSGGQQQAVNLRAEKDDTMPLRSVKQMSISRAKGLGKVFATLDGAYVGKPTGISIYEDIGVNVERYYTTAENQSETGIAIVFSLEEEGPGGWFGVTVSIDGRQFVIPVEIVDAFDENGDEDDSLTATLNPSSVVPGARNVGFLNIQLPSMSAENRPLLGSLVTRVSPIISGYDADVDNISDEGSISATMTADFSYGLAREAELSEYNLRIPVGVTTSQGAAIGFWSIGDKDMPVTEQVNLDSVEVGFQDTRSSSDFGETAAYTTVSFPWENVEDILSKPVTFVKVVAFKTAPEYYTPATVHLVDWFDRGNLKAVADDGVLWVFGNKRFVLWASSQKNQIVGGATEGYQFTITSMGHLNEPLEVSDMGDTDTTEVNDSENADTDSTGQNMDGVTPCVSPMLYFEELENYTKYTADGDLTTMDIAPYTDNITEMLPDADCRIAIVISARTLDRLGRSTPDTVLTAYDENDMAVMSTTNFAGGPDPILYVNASDVEELELRGEMGTFGYYMVNVRQPAIIRQVSTEIDNTYVELQMEPGTSLENCQLIRPLPAAEFDTDTTPDSETVPTEGPSLQLSGTVPADGRVFVTSLDVPWRTIEDTQNVTHIPPKSSFSYQLVCSDLLIDSFEVMEGFEQSAETQPNAFTNVKATCFARIGNGIDTNNNQYDLVRKSDCTVQ
ncbi:MAG: hypothetical protein JXX29_08495 [Deltaproteobacteria bacterium]|nr:hypothetical protein [Deltaproteobacteria bacterium]MBN2671700.1 hypothetical protein [Deltaproteobacteria bacterium]